MRTIQVDPNVNAVPTYGSASKAILADKKTPRAKRAVDDSPLVASGTMNEFAISDGEIRIFLSNEYVLGIMATERWVEWSVRRSATMSGDAGPPYTPVCLIWPSGERTTFDASALLESRRPFPLHMLRAGEAYLNVYFKGGGMLRFDPLWNCSARSPMLYISEMEPIRRSNSRKGAADRL